MKQCKSPTCNNQAMCSLKLKNGKVHYCADCGLLALKGLRAFSMWLVQNKLDLHLLSEVDFNKEFTRFLNEKAWSNS
jgi:hypothetical protein